MRESCVEEPEEIALVVVEADGVVAPDAPVLQHEDALPELRGVMRSVRLERAALCAEAQRAVGLLLDRLQHIVEVGLVSGLA